MAVIVEFTRVVDYGNEPHENQPLHTSWMEAGNLPAVGDIIRISDCEIDEETLYEVVRRRFIITTDNGMDSGFLNEIHFDITTPDVKRKKRI